MNCTFFNLIFVSFFFQFGVSGERFILLLITLFDQPVFGNNDTVLTLSFGCLRHPDFLTIYWRAFIFNGWSTTYFYHKHVCR